MPTQPTRASSKLKNVKVVMEKVKDTVCIDSPTSTTTARGDEKGGILHIDLEEERRIVRKLDLTIVPIMALFYLLSFLVS